ncbi:MAG: diguanylate cyclase [Deltaproteobacteria bacterium]|nr:diguanylate cyclase [Deltaproteobacteria bacterium]
MPNQQAGRPAGAELHQVFMKFPAPLALVSLGGAMLMGNLALAERFGAGCVVSDGVAEAARSQAETCRIKLRSQDRDGVIEVVARAIRLPGRLLLVLETSTPPATLVELEQLRTRISQLERLAATDHLTGAWNRAHFDRLIDAELARSRATRQPLSLVLLDVDHFKKINDGLGHATGDAVLRELVTLVQARTRASDVLFRWGGEEFAVLASSAGYRGAERLADNLCRAVAAHPFHRVGSVTISLGVAERLGDETAAAWFERLDQALYAAKQGGRNRVVVDRRGDSDVWAAETGASAMHLSWQEAYECGEPTIDAEHRELFTLANLLLDAALQGSARPAAFRDAFATLIEQVERHFADEEAILARHHYAALEPHKRAHAGLLRRAHRLMAQAEAGGVSLGAVVEFLAQDVVARHLLAVDRAFFPLFERA